MSVKTEAGMALKTALAGDDGAAIADAFEALMGACEYGGEEDSMEEDAPSKKPGALVLAIGGKK